jgi:hypothetical protein
MAITVRALLKSVAGLFTVLVGTASSANALGSRRETLTMSQLIARLRQDARLCRRFADDPRAVLIECGIDPAPYNLPDRMSSAQMDRLLAQLAQAPAPPDPETPPTRPKPAPPAPVYGPPPRPPQPPRPPPPAPVYGPPPGLPK